MRFLSKNTGNISQKLLEEIESTFSIKSGFTKAYLKKVASNYDLSNINSITELYKLNSGAESYWNFAFSTILRGRNVAEIVLPYTNSNISNKKYLDVGCAYGGYLIAFFEKGFEVKGLEVNPSLAELGKINCMDYGIPDSIIVDDFLECNMEELGKFDVVTCNDVIEHIPNVDTTIERLCGCLNKGGVLLLEVPNKNCLSFINRDGHFDLFGINLLERASSLKYLEENKPQIYSDLKKDYPKNFGMGEFYDKGFYISRLENNDMSVSVRYDHHLIGNIDEVPSLMAKIVNSFNDYYYEKRQKTDYFVSEELIKNFFMYIENFAKDYQLSRYYGKTREFKEKYMTTFWTLIAKKI